VSVRTTAYRVPTDRAEADGTLRWSSTVVVVVEIERGAHRGVGYTYADVATAIFIDAHLAEIFARADPMSVGATYDAMIHETRNLGREGVTAMAISAVDVAAWDLKARMLGVSVVSLLGARRRSLRAYASGAFTSYTREELLSWIVAQKEAGFDAVKMKIAEHPEDDVARVRACRETLGDRVEIFVDANGGYARKQAVAIAEALDPLGVTWFEEPVREDDFEGLRFVRERAPARMEIAVGEYGYTSRYFQRALATRAVDVMQADATRCGGFTGFMRVAAMCDDQHVRLSSHCAPTLHAHVGCAAPAMVHAEHFHDHVRIEGMLFDGAVHAERGVLRPDASAPGLCLALREGDASRHRVLEKRRDVEGAS
jgi:L-alanine-DL-glutamate epimerase-like enolase superfamily enzyme